MTAIPFVSIVVCTHGSRETPLRRLVSALRRQTQAFELVVVLGPADEGTQRAVSAAEPSRIVTCGSPNISRARNLGIGAAGGDVIAFIDDDAVPVRRDWLASLTRRLADATLGAVGGPVFRSDSDTVEFAGGATSLCGFQHFDTPAPDEAAPDGTPWFPRVAGGNCAMPRRVLAAIGGFDEQFAYYLDEADVCLRLIAAGFDVAYEPDAPVRHYAAPSVFGPAGLRARRAVARSDGYFVLRHGPGSRWRRALFAVRTHASKHFVTEGRALLARGELRASALVTFRLDCWRGLACGLWAGLVQQPVHAEVPPPPPWAVSQRSPAPFVVVLDACDAVAEDPPAEALLAAWMETLKDLGLAVGAISERERVREIADIACRFPTSMPDPVRLDLESAPELSQAASDAARWLAALSATRWLTEFDLLIWAGSSMTATLLAEALGDRLVCLSLPRRPSTSLDEAALSAGGGQDRRTLGSTADIAAVAQVLGAQACREAVHDGPIPASTLAASFLIGQIDPQSDSSTPATALRTIVEVVRHCLRDGRPDLALRLGEAGRRAPAASRDEAVELDYHIAHALRARGREDEAWRLYRSIRERRDDVPASARLVAGACYHLACEALTRSKQTEAVVLLAECLERLPDHVAARRLLASVASSGGD
ncbi:MAG: glycosyltransferase [Vicinamibacteraceae bacterium]|nr:glycosyltransferase [Vicinamibacteraceae bacterium]